LRGQNAGSLQDLGECADSYVVLRPPAGFVRGERGEQEVVDPRAIGRRCVRQQRRGLVLDQPARDLVE